jgi:hypothetical protein
MNTEEPYRDQAERLKRRIEKINNKNEDSSDLIPPREQIHRQKKTKTKWKLKYPVIRLLVLFFILLPIIIFSVISYLDGKKINGAEKTNGNSAGYEEINFEKPKNEKVKTTPNKVEKQKLSEQVTNPPSQPINQEIQTDNNSTATEKSTSTSGTNTSTSEKIIDKSSAGQPGTTTSGTTSAAKSTKIIYHTVKQKETLYNISMQYYHSKYGIVKIQKANHIRNNQITTGQILKIPVNN